MNLFHLLNVFIESPLYQSSIGIECFVTYIRNSVTLSIKYLFSYLQACKLPGELCSVGLIWVLRCRSSGIIAKIKAPGGAVWNRRRQGSHVLELT